MHRVLLLLLAGLSAPSARADSPPPSQPRQEALLNMLRQDCGSCHGMSLKGGLGPALLPENLQGKPDAFLLETILNGRPGTAMPPWRDLMTTDDAAWLLKQLRNAPP